jgi:hypothetical protein
MYESAAEFVINYKIEDDYLQRFRQIVFDTKDIGWGFHDMLGEMFYKYFSKKITAEN